MLRILTDADTNPRVAQQVQIHRPECSIVSLHEWKGAQYLDAPDPEILAVAHEFRLTLLTYDQATIMSLLGQWGEQGRDHSGVIFVDNRTIAQNDIGRQVRAVIEIWDAEREFDWRNRVRYLERPVSQ